jgi:hypothetical protein
MDILSAKRKTEIFEKAIQYGLDAAVDSRLLHDQVGEDLGQEIWWRQNDGVDPEIGIIGEFVWDDGEKALLITTARCCDYRELVSFTYAHEVGHASMKHGKGAEGSILLRTYTVKEAEADAFAYAYLYVTCQTMTPCGGPMPYHRVEAALQSVHAGDRAFRWTTIQEDRDLVRAIRDRLGRAGGPPSPRPGSGACTAS